MEFQSLREKERKKGQAKRALQTAIRALIMPIAEKIYAAAEAAKEREKAKWATDKDRREKEVLKEMTRYIEKKLARGQEGEYWVYNSARNEHVSFSNAMYLREFLAQSWRIGKDSKKSNMFYAVFMQGSKEQNKQYDAFFAGIKSHFERFEDIEFEEGAEEEWRGSQPYLILKLKKT